MINYYWVEVKGKNLRRYLNYVIKSKINIEAIKYEKEKILLKISYEDYKKLKKIKSSYQIKIIKKSGKNRIIDIYQKYKLPLLILTLSIFFLVFLSKQILIISINTNNTMLKEIVKEELKKNDISVFTTQKSFKKLKRISSKIKKNNENSIEWIEFDQKGVKLNVEVIERIKKETKEKTEYKDIVAKKDGYIRKIVSTKGEILKNIDDYVKKDEIIVSGNIFRNQKVSGQVRANGKVYAEVWYITKLNKSLFYSEMVEKEYGRVNITLTINNHKIKMISVPKKITKTKKIEIFKNDFFSLNFETERKYKLKQKKYTKSELGNIMETIAKTEMQKKLKQEEYIIKQKTLKKYIKNDKMYIEIFFTVYEDIAMEKNIQEIKESNEE